MFSPAFIARYPGFIDLVGSVKMWRLWLRLGWMDILRRYRRTKIGPFWGTLSVGAFIGAMGFLYAGIFGQDPSEYIPYVAAGFAIWLPLSTFVVESTSTFISAENTIKHSAMPFTVFVWQAVIRNLIVFAHNLPIYVLVAVIFSVPLHINMLLVFPGLLLLLINAGWLGLVVSLICTRYRDVQQLVATIMQMLFFVTPIFWQAGQAGRVRTIFVELNPAFHLVDIVRSPLLGIAPTQSSWLFVCGMGVGGWVFALAMFNRYRARVVLWV